MIQLDQIKIDLHHSGIFGCCHTAGAAAENVAEKFLDCTHIQIEVHGITSPQAEATSLTALTNTSERWA